MAQKVLAGATRGYRHHPQLIRFQAQARPLDSIAAYLRGLETEARRRGYRFDASKIARSERVRKIDETEGQLLFEWAHLRSKLLVRAPLLGRQCRRIVRPKQHPLFRIIPGRIRDWERIRPPGPAMAKPVKLVRP